MANEMRLIDANAYESDIRKLFVQYGDGTYLGDREAMIYDEALVDALYALNEAPTVDAVPVVHGRWKKHDATGYVGCSNCWDVFVDEEWLTEGRWNYCPNCGAKMDGDGNG